jgi:hypothetical protein
MATRAEQARYAEERDHKKKPAKKKAVVKTASAKKAPTNESKRAGKKAVYKLEEHEEGKRPSRKSTRKGANHLKADTNIVLRSARAARKPETKARKPAAAATRTRAKKG